MTVQQWRVCEAALPEDFGDEIICMAIDSGVFYSLRGSAAALWRAIAAGTTAALITEAVNASPDAATLMSLIEALVADGILELVDADAPETPAPDFTDSGPAEYTRNDQFNDLVLLDPIHDVTERGWPFT